MYTDEYDREWRFSVNEHDGTITRGRAYRLPEDWTTDAWSNYWDGDGQIAFTVDYHYGGRHVILVTEGNDMNDLGERLIEGRNRMLDRGGWPDSYLDRAARLITGEPESRFIHVGLDRGTDLYALSWDGDSDNTWRDEIEAVWNCDIWRIECEEYAPGMGTGGSDWTPADEYPEEFYGEDKARAGWEKAFDLAEFPTENTVDGSN